VLDTRALALLLLLVVFSLLLPHDGVSHTPEGQIVP
jgi:hypothetical protein